MKKKRTKLYALALSTILFVSLAGSVITAEAATNRVRSRRDTAISLSQTTGDTTSTLIDVETAKTTALNHAGLTADQVTFIQQKLDWEDGRQVYEIEFYTGNYSEYDYEIDASTGAIVSFDYDAEYYAPPATGSAADGGTTISESKAIEIALSYVSGATTSNVTKCKLDRDDGRLEYEIEIRYNYREYEFEIDASTGTVIDWEID